MMLHKHDPIPAQLALASLLRKQAEDLSRLLGDLDSFWVERISRLVQTEVEWADRLEDGHGGL